MGGLRMLVQLAEPDLIALIRSEVRLAVREEFAANATTIPDSSQRPAFVSPKEAAAELGCCERNVRDLIKKGRLQAAKIVPGQGSSRVRIPRASLDRLLAESMR